MASRFTRPFIKGFFANPRVREAGRQFGVNATAAIVQDQFESATGIKVRSPVPRTMPGVAGSAFGTFAANGMPRYSPMARPTNRMATHVTSERITGALASYHTVAQATHAVTQMGVPMAHAGDVMTAAARGRTAELPQSTVLMVASSSSPRIWR
jgi:hypothetical protein